MKIKNHGLDSLSNVFSSKKLRYLVGLAFLLVSLLVVALPTTTNADDLDIRASSRTGWPITFGSSEDDNYSLTVQNIAITSADTIAVTIAGNNQGIDQRTYTLTQLGNSSQFQSSENCGGNQNFPTISMRNVPSDPTSIFTLIFNHKRGGSTAPTVSCERFTVANANTVLPAMTTQGDATAEYIMATGGSSISRNNGRIQFRLLNDASATDYFAIVGVSGSASTHFVYAVTNESDLCRPILVVQRSAVTSTSFTAIDYNLGGGSTGCNIEEQTSVTVSNPNPLTDPGDIIPGDPADDTAGAEEFSGCEELIGGGLSWALCSLINLLGGVVVGAVRFVYGGDDYSNLAVGQEITGTDSSAFAVWQLVRNVSNVALLIVGLYIIISIMTGIGNSGGQNYALKKLVPRMLFAVILIQISWYGVGFVIEANNSLAYGAEGLFEQARGSAASDVAFSNYNDDEGFFENTFVQIGGGALGTIALAGVAGYVILFSSFSILAFVGIAALWLIAVMAALVVRKALIVALIVFSPLVVVLWIIPQTANWAKRWWDLLSKLLIMFAIIVIMLELGELMSQLFNDDRLADQALTETEIRNNFLDRFALRFFGMVSDTLGALGAPFAFAIAGSTLSRVTGIINNNKNRGPIDGLRNRKKQRLDANKAYKRQQSAVNASDPSRGRAGRVIGKIPGLKDTGLAAWQYKARAGGVNFNKQDRVAQERLDKQWPSAKEKVTKEEAAESAERIIRESAEIEARLEGNEDQYISEDTDANGNAVWRVKIIDAEGKADVKNFGTREDAVAGLSDVVATNHLRRIAFNVDGKQSQADRRAAISRMVDMTDFDGVDGAIEKFKSSGVAGRELASRILSENAGNLASKAPDILKGDAGRVAGQDFASLASAHPTMHKRIVRKLEKVIETGTAEQKVKASQDLKTYYDTLTEGAVNSQTSHLLASGARQTIVKDVMDKKQAAIDRGEVIPPSPHETSRKNFDRVLTGRGAEETPSDPYRDRPGVYN